MYTYIYVYRYERGVQEAIAKYVLLNSKERARLGWPVCVYMYIQIYIYVHVSLSLSLSIYIYI